LTARNSIQIKSLSQARACRYSPASPAGPIHLKGKTMLPSSSSSAEQSLALPFQGAQQFNDHPALVPRSLSAPMLTAGPGVANRPGQNGAPVVYIALPRESLIKWAYNDSHFHPTQYTQQGRSPDSLIADMDRLGIQYTTLMPIPTNVLSSQPEPDWNPCSGTHHCGPSYYLPPRMLLSRTLRKEDMAEARQATELYMNTGVDSTTAGRYGQLTAAQKKRFDPMITGLHLGDMHSSTYLLEKLHQHPGTFTGVGEITVHKEVVEQLFAGERQANLGDNAAPLKKLLETCGAAGMPVVLHCDVDVPGAQPLDAPAYLEGIRRLFSDPLVSGTAIVWAHAGGLGRFVNAPAGHVHALRAMLADACFRHVHIDLSWTVVAERLVEDRQTLLSWIQLINDYPRRFLYGSDALAPKDSERWNQTYAKYQEMMNSLTPVSRELVCKGNYERVFVAARSKVRAFERYLLPGIIAELRKPFLPQPIAQGLVTGTAIDSEATAFSMATRMAPSSPEKTRQ
jgi:hypothetical protein